MVGGMRTAGAIVLGVGLIIALVVAMVPISVDVFGDSGSCGAPLLRVISQQKVDDPNEQRLIDLCEDKSVDRLAIAGPIALVSVLVGGGLMLAARGRGSSSQSPAPPPAAAASSSPDSTFRRRDDA